VSKAIAILGAGESGTGAAMLAHKKGLKVFVSDTGKIADKFKNVLLQLEIDFEEGFHSSGKILVADEIIKSPGIPDNAEIVQKAKQKGIPVISEIEFAGRYTKAKKICITGSNGKTTTTLLTGHILKKAGLDVAVCGNVGTGMARLLSQRDYQYLVLEISSFQLDGMFDFKADIAVLLNITPDHLDRYENNFSRYAASKFRIIQNQSEHDAFIYNADDENIRNMLDKISCKAQLFPFSMGNEALKMSGFLRNNQNNHKNSKIVIQVKNTDMIVSLHEIALSGQHNVYNSMAASIAARFLDIRKKSIKESLADFQGVEHRLEYVASVRGIQFINDSKATNVNSTWYALENANRPVIWIAGGLDKGNDYSALLQLVTAKVKAIICLGIDNRKIMETFSPVCSMIIETQSMADAVKTAYNIGNKGDSVLLSPACASFDLFVDYEDRGRQFKKEVINL
jgi:UDP-N-acetylmuramoylalanine--D-glutamate ligase